MACRDCESLGKEAYLTNIQVELQAWPVEALRELLSVVLKLKLIGRMLREDD